MTILVPDSRVMGVHLQLIGPAAGYDLTDAISGDSHMERTVDGATVLTVNVADRRRTFLTSGAFGSRDNIPRNYTAWDGIRFEQCAVGYTGGSLVLTFEDAVVRACKRVKTPRHWAGQTVTRAGLAKLLAEEAGVPIVCDPQARPTIADTVTRNMTMDAGRRGTADNTYVADAAGQDTSWSVLQSLAADIGWRCFSDGERLVFGSDDWIMGLSPALSIAPETGAVQEVDLELDEDQDASSATVTVDADRWAVPPGQAVDLSGMGPGDGRWLVESFRKPMARLRGTVTLTRARPVLAEPKPDPAAAGEPGEQGYLADPLGDLSFLGLTPAGTAPTSLRIAERDASSPLGRFLNFALQQSGKRYVWGASGPDTFDCSGLVQQAAAAAGLRFPKPARNQLALIRRGQGQPMSVQQALATRGALLFRVDYPGQGDHVVISLGDGTTVEARGAAYGCGIFANAATRRWNAGGMLNFGVKLTGVGTGRIGGPV